MDSKRGLVDPYLNNTTNDEQQYYVAVGSNISKKTDQIDKPRSRTSYQGSYVRSYLA